jgi:hypothetical protein
MLSRIIIAPAPTIIARLTGENAILNTPKKK